jgi:hypothetical protein
MWVIAIKEWTWSSNTTCATVEGFVARLVISVCQNIL